LRLNVAVFASGLSGPREAGHAQQRVQERAADKTTRSRLGHSGSRGLNVSERSHSAHAIEAEPSGGPG